jgi:hypothetical protein
MRASGREEIKVFYRLLGKGVMVRHSVSGLHGEGEFARSIKMIYCQLLANLYSSSFLFVNSTPAIFLLIVPNDHSQSLLRTRYRHL